MILIQKLTQYRRDFTGIYKCESCGYKQESGGYDDDYYHRKVIPAMRCRMCKATGTKQTSWPGVPPHVTI
jgi:ribosomal protein L37AE/L43A